MTWTIRYRHTAIKTLKTLDRNTQKRIVTYLQDLTTHEDPRTRAKPLTGYYKGLWRCRIGDYRLICDFIDNDLVIVAVEIGHRSTIYKRPPAPH